MWLLLANSATGQLPKCVSSRCQWITSSQVAEVIDYDPPAKKLQGLSSASASPCGSRAALCTSVISRTQRCLRIVKLFKFTHLIKNALVDAPECAECDDF